jgi:hypothetical protein
MAWLNALQNFNHKLQRDTQLLSSGDSLLAALADLRRIARPGSAIFIVSDFAGTEHSDVRERMRELLYGLARHCEVSALFIFDPLERELPPPALYTVTDGQQRMALDSGENTLRLRHRAAFEERLQTLQQLFTSMAIPLLEASTEQAPLTLFRQSAARHRRRTAP